MENIKPDEDHDSVIRPESHVSRPASYAMIFLAYSFGAISLFVFMIFLYIGSLNLVRLNLSPTAVLGLNLLLSLAFFTQHSLMVRRSFRLWLSKFIQPQFQGALFTIASGVALLAVVVFWQPSDVMLVSSQGIARWILRLIFLLAIGGFYWGVKALGTFDGFGIRPIKRQLRGKKPPAEMPFVVRGPYRWMRHPLYFFCLLLIWSCPDLTLDRLLFNVLWTLWIFVGAKLEERDLVEDFGDTYRDYQRKVPMIIPWRF